MIRTATRSNSLRVGADIEAQRSGRVTKLSPVDFGNGVTLGHAGEVAP